MTPTCCPSCDAHCWTTGVLILADSMADALLPVFEELLAEVARLRAHILDIDAHATPYDDIPGDFGWVDTYLLTAGALHRALGTIGHSAPSCQAEQERDEARAEVDRLRAERDRAVAVELNLDGLAAELAEALFDEAHEHCDSEGSCAGGGLPVYLDLVQGLLMPIIRERLQAQPTAPSDAAIGRQA